MKLAGLIFIVLGFIAFLGHVSTTYHDGAIHIWCFIATLVCFLTGAILFNI